jgi:hypothetical protein
MTGKPACPEFLPEKTNPTLLKTATSRIRLARFPSGSAVIQHRFRPRNRCQLVLRWEVVESVSPLFESAQLVAGRAGSVAMPVATTCDCSVCEMELRLLASLASAEPLPAFTESSQFRAYSSVQDLVRLLRTSPAKAQSDGMLAELVEVRAARPAFIDSVLVLVFVPMLHGMVRSVVAYQPALAEEDVVQQAIAALLEFLRTEDMRVRKSHFAFAISRAVKRQVFLWAAREGMKDRWVDQAGDSFPPILADEPFERYAQLRHFLHRCATRGDLAPSELDLLIQFKLEGSNGDMPHASNGNS